MKKPIYLLLLAVTAFFFSCKDKTNEFGEQLFTNSQISSALKECILITVSTTAKTLCVVDSADHQYGYYWYEDSTYRLVLPSAIKDTLIAHDQDTLIVHNFERQLNALIYNMNKAAEQCGDKIINFWKPVVQAIVFPNPNQLLHGENKAITNYVKETKQTAFISELVTSTLKEQFDALDVSAAWNELQIEYNTITGNYSSFDLLASCAQQMSDGYFKMMGITEEAIRKDPSLRGSPSGLLYQVFATL
jgi:hypothetical protein